MLESDTRAQMRSADTDLGGWALAALSAQPSSVTLGHISPHRPLRLMLQLSSTLYISMCCAAGASLCIMHRLEEERPSDLCTITRFSTEYLVLGTRRSTGAQVFRAVNDDRRTYCNVHRYHVHTSQPHFRCAATISTRRLLTHRHIQIRTDDGRWPASLTRARSEHSNPSRTPARSSEHGVRSSDSEESEHGLGSRSEERAVQSACN